MPSSEDYRQFLEVFYPFFLITSLISQLFVIYFILNYTPKQLQTLRYILVNTCVFQVIHVSACYLMQFRQVSNLVPMEVWSYGYGRHFEAFVGYSLYHVVQVCGRFSISKTALKIADINGCQWHFSSNDVVPKVRSS